MEITRYGPTIVSRFWAKTDRRGDDECWPWTGSTDANGYGWLRGRKHGPHRSTRAHRASYEIANGVDPADSLVCHSCDNPRCVNPAHLFLGTVRDNCDDMIAKGRAVHPAGAAHPRSRLSSHRVSEARRRVAGGETVTALAAEFGVGTSTLAQALRGETWRDVRD